MSNFNSDLLNDLSQRGCIANCSALASLDHLLASGEKVTVYAGFDPTAHDLHVGHLLTLTMLRRFMLAGHHVVPVIGTATAMVGDPSGRTSARPILDAAIMSRNAGEIWHAILCGIGIEEDETNLPEITENGIWFAQQNWMSFLLNVGSLVSVGRLLAFQNVAQRLAPAGAGMSFLELAYPLMQGYDFLHLHQQHGNLVQIGGSDQWGNICMGLDIISRTPGASMKDGKETVAIGLTHPLLTTVNGDKMGKSAGNAIWLSPKNLSDFDFFQFWRNVEDPSILKFALCLSDRPVDDLRGMADRDINSLKEMLAVEMTARVRDNDAANKSLEASRGKGMVATGLAEFDVMTDDMDDLMFVLVKTGLTESKGQARRLAVQNGIKVNGIVRSDNMLFFSDFHDGLATLSVGKTRHVALRFIAT